MYIARTRELLQLFQSVGGGGGEGSFRLRADIVRERVKQGRKQYNKYRTRPTRA